MKIKKLNENLLTEQDNLDTETVDVPDIDPEASVSEIADAVQTAVEVETAGESTISDADAEQVADEIKTTSAEINAGSVGVIPSEATAEEYVVRTELTDILDKALAASKRFMRQGVRFGANVLVTGLPGSGKTAVVESWGKLAGVNIVSLNATDPKIETIVNGMPLRDESDPENKNAITRVFDQGIVKKLGQGNVVLFIDELNRQNDTKLRRAFLSLINEKRNADGSLNFEKSILFTVACINPNCKEDRGATPLTDVERSRFVYNLPNADSNTTDARGYFSANTRSRLAKLGIQTTKKDIDGIRVVKVSDLYKDDPTKAMSEEEKEKYYLNKDVEEEVKISDITEYILTSADFEFNTREDRSEIEREQKNILNQRLLTDALRNAGGDKTEFLYWVDHYSELLDSTKEMLHRVLDDYIFDKNDAYAALGILPAAEETTAATDTTDTATANNAEAEEEVEDDADLFANTASSAASGRVAPKPADAEAIINDWFNNF